MLHEYHCVLFVAGAGERVVKSVNHYTGMAKAVGKYKAVEVIILYIVLGSFLFLIINMQFQLFNLKMT